MGHRLGDCPREHTPGVCARTPRAAGWAAPGTVQPAAWQGPQAHMMSRAGTEKSVMVAGHSSPAVAEEGAGGLAGGPNRGLLLAGPCDRPGGGSLLAAANPQPERASSSSSQSPCCTKQMGGQAVHLGLPPPGWEAPLQAPGLPRLPAFRCEWDGTGETSQGCLAHIKSAHSRHARVSWRREVHKCTARCPCMPG